MWENNEEWQRRDKYQTPQWNETKRNGGVVCCYPINIFNRNDILWFEEKCNMCLNDNIWENNTTTNI